MTGISKVVPAGVVCMIALASGCASKEVEVWMPPPRTQWDDIMTRPVTPADNEYRILRSEPTRGLFPSNIGVARVAVEDPDEEPFVRRRCLIRKPRNEFLAWNKAFDEQMAVSEVFPIAQRDLGGAKVDAEQIVAATRALDAGIAMVYAVNELSETETEMFGTLYDTEAAMPIAAFHARAESITPTEDSDDAPDLWLVDSKALVRAKFERFVHACVRELVLHDQPAPLETPTGWTPAGPIMPVEWPPRHFRTGG